MCGFIFNFKNVWSKAKSNHRLLAHPEMTCFQLTEAEYKDALKENPELENESYIERTATSIIEPTINCYFTNETILKQFKQLFYLHEIQ